MGVLGHHQEPEGVDDVPKLHDAVSAVLVVGRRAAAVHDMAAQHEGEHTDLRMAQVNRIRRHVACDHCSVWFGVLEDRFCEAAPYAVDAHAELLDQWREQGYFCGVWSRCARCIRHRGAGFYAQTYVPLGSRVLFWYTLLVWYNGLITRP